MNVKNKVRSKLREVIFSKYYYLFERVHLKSLDNIIDLHKTKEGRKIINIMRTKIGYSKSTANVDIFNSAYMNWKKYAFSEKTMYNNYKDERRN